MSWFDCTVSLEDLALGHCLASLQLFSEVGAINVKKKQYSSDSFSPFGVVLFFNKLRSSVL